MVTSLPAGRVLPIGASGALYALGLCLTAYLLGWHQFLPILGSWEHYEYYYAYGAVDPHLSFVIAPRANVGGKGYPLLDLGVDLANFLDLGLVGFRAIIFIYALTTAVLLLTVLSRWFGSLPAFFGVTLTLFSMGFVVHANQVLVVMPTLMLSLFLVERCQRLDRNIDDIGSVLTIGIILSLLAIHYGTGRIFAAGWMIFTLGLQITLAKQAFGWSPALKDFTWQRIVFAATATLVMITALCLLDYRNIGPLADPLNIFLRRKTPEVEFDLAKLIPTVWGNIPRMLEMLFPFVSISGAGRPENFLAGHRAPIFDYWHAPVLVLGAVIALRRTFQRCAPMSMPYLALHAILVLTVGIFLFSQRFEEIWTVSAYRIFIGYIAFAGYATVAFAWLGEVTAGRSGPLPSLAVPVGGGILLVVAALGLTNEAESIRSRIDSLARPDQTGDRFAPVPVALPYGYEPNLYLQARYRELARRLAPALDCDSPGPLLLIVDPRLLLNRGAYDGLHYVRYFNDLSATLALYLADVSHLNPAHVIVHGKNDRGFKDWGQGYGGTPRVFSGPIDWVDGAIRYRATPPLVRHLRPARPLGDPDVIISFSRTETDAARETARDRGWRLRELAPLTRLRQLQGSGSAMPPRCPLGR